MASNFKFNGTDLDSIFAPYHAGWPQAAATNDKVSGSDLNGRYAALVSGNATSATTFKVGGTDLNAIFAAINSTSVQVGTQPGNVSGSRSAGTPSGSVTSGNTTCAGAKGGGSYTYTWHISYTVGSGVSFTAGSSATTGVTCPTVPAGQTYSGTMYCTISDGVTSANTSSVGWALTNSSAASGNFSITAGQVVSGSNSTTGYRASPALGSGSSLTLPDGHTVTELADLTQTDGNQGATLVVGGFSSDPGVNYFSSITCNGKIHTPSDSTTAYSYASGVATWTWLQYGTLAQTFGFSNGGNYSATINF